LPACLKDQTGVTFFRSSKYEFGPEQIRQVTAYEQTTKFKDRSDSITQLVFRSIHSSKAIRALFRVPLAAMPEVSSRRQAN
jgi:hypothetical protein